MAELAPGRFRVELGVGDSSVGYGVLMWRSSGRPVMNAPNRKDRNGPPLSGDQGDRDELNGVRVGQVLEQGRAIQEPFVLGEGELDRRDCIVLVGGR